MAKRDFVHERLQEDPKRKAERAARNRARLKLEKAGHAMAGKQANHRDGNPLNNNSKNLEPMSPKKNNTGRRGGSPKKEGK
jgi:hypothetical protein